MQKLFMQVGAIFGAIAVSLGAFGAHALKNYLLANNRTETFETAVKYLFYHALALILAGILASTFNSKYMDWSGKAFMAGTLIFSGSLFLICFTGITKFGAIAPIGGILLILGWIFMFLAISK